MKLAQLFRLPNIVKVAFAQILLLILISIGFYLWKGAALVLLFAVIWFDKVLLIHLKIHGELGIEFLTIPVILSGIIYGPWFGFLFGFLILAFIGGVFELISWIISPPFEIGWPPIVPSPDTFLIGLTGLVGGLLSEVNFVTVVLIGTVIKNALKIVIHRITSDEPLSISLFLNILFNVVLAFIVGKYVLSFLTSF